MLHAPLAAIERGEPRFGTYQGLVGRPDWRQLTGDYHRSAWWRFCHHKQWQYVALFTPRLVLGMAVVDVGYAANGFLYLFDRQAKKMLVDRSKILPPSEKARVGLPGEGARTSFQARGLHISLARPRGSSLFALQATTQDKLAVEAELDLSNAPVPLTAIAPIPHGVANCTQKHACIPVRGHLTFQGQRHDLSEGVATLDHTDGLLARETSWRWASGHSRDLGFNLVDGFNANCENVAWVGGELFQLGAAHFSFDPLDPLSPWRITTEDGLLELQFKPEGLRRKNEDLLVALSRYIQPIGCFEGRLRTRPDGPWLALSGIPGVTEDHQARW